MLKSFGRRLLARLRARPDKEHEITLNRLAIALIVLVYLFVILPPDPSLHLAQGLCTSFAVGAVLLFAHLLARPGISVIRRFCGMVLDLGILTAGLYVASPVISALYPFYLWVIFGYGFRYGLKYLFTATGLSVACFAMVIHAADYWQANYPLALGLLSGLVVLPLYAATLVRKLSLARDQAEKANQAKSLFLASVSHELRTPLNAVIGMSDVLRTTRLTVDQTDMISTIRNSANRLVSLIDDLLDVSRIDSGRVAFDAVLFDPVATLRDILRVVSPQAAEKGLRLHMHVTPGVPRSVLADRRRFGEIVLNLLANAVKFTHEGGVTLAIDAVPQSTGIQLRVVVCDTGIGVAASAHQRIFETFSQADESISNNFGGTGLGLAISQRLVRLQGGEIGLESQPGKGSTFWFTLPMGLPATTTPKAAHAAYQVVLLASDPSMLDSTLDALAHARLDTVEANDVTEAHRILALPLPVGIQGRIMLLPAPEDAAKVDAWLTGLPGDVPMLMVQRRARPGLPSMPLASRVFAVSGLDTLRDDLPGILSALATVHEPANDDIPLPIRRRENGRRILVVDDNRVNQMVISRILQAGGHHVTLADHGEEALERLDEIEFDLVAMDLNMPVMDGIEATKLYRMASLDLPHLPIIALTADATEYARTRALEAGMDACITKPVDAAALLDLIDRLLEGKQIRPQLVPVRPRPAPPPAEAPSEKPLNEGMLLDLVVLGGQEFVSSVIAAFIPDAHRHLADLRVAVAVEDVQQFRDKLHALHSSAVNVGALILPSRCKAWQSVDRDMLRLDGARMLEQLTEDVETTRAALLRWQALPPTLVRPEE
jgi:two-component system sensor histidine kinase RpfC